MYMVGTIKDTGMNYTYEPPQKPGNTKYLLDGHWFMEIDGNC